MNSVLSERTRHGAPLPAGSPRLSRRSLGAGALAAGVVAVAGCGSGEGGEGSARDRRAKVTFLTTFGQQGRDSYAHVAVEKGFFDEVGLDVTIEPGKAGGYNHDKLLAGKAHYATVDGSGAFVRFATGKDTSFQVLAAIHQRTVVGIIGLEGGRISRDSPRSLEGTTLGTIRQAVPETLFPAYARQAGFSPKKVKWQYAGEPAQLNTLVGTGKLDGAGLFVVGVPGVESAAQGRKTVVLPYSDVLTEFYGAVVVAQKATIDANPDQARRFTNALLKGLDYAVKNPQEAGEIMARRAGQKADVAAAELELMRAYVFGAGVVTAGVMDPSRVARMVASLESHQLIPLGSNPDLPNKIVRFDIAPTA